MTPEERYERQVLAAHFDARFYAERYPDVDRDGLQHFITYGWREGRDPAPWFSTVFYLESNPDVAEAGINPFFHYVEHGREEGRPAVPNATPSAETPWEVEAIKQGLDDEFYAAQLRRLGLASQDVDLADHYWREGAKLGLDPAPNFSTRHYLADHPDVAANGVNPLAHFLKEGQKEGRGVRSPQPLELVEIAEPSPPPTEEGRGWLKRRNPDRELASGAFDSEYYLSAYPDVRAAGKDPLDHFLGAGWREGRNPNLWFSVNQYLELYPDVAAAGINPFLHYLMAGKAEGRLPRHDLGFRYEVIAGLQSLEARTAHARASAPSRSTSDGSSLRDALRRATRIGTKGLYLSVSHDDFTENLGGVQLVLMRESVAVDALGFDHLHLFPATPLLTAELELEDPVIGVLLNCDRVGFFPASVIAREMAAIAPRIATQPFVIHSLIGHRAEALLDILKAAGCQSGWYWVHDYSSVCTGYTLLRNDVEFCGAPPPTSTACSICVYGSHRVQQMEAHELLFRSLDLTVLAPSDAALNVWKSGFGIAAPAKVHEHLRLASTNQAVSSRTDHERPLRIAYVGQPVTHKGWPVFRELAVTFADDPRYEFYHLGKHPQGIPATFKEVAVRPGELDAMVRAIGELEIDVAVLWSLWPETFCIAAVEALQAGAAVLTFKDSGNVAALVKKTGHGAVLDSEKELMALFDSGEVVKLAAQTRPDGLSAEFSNMTVDFLEEEAA